MKRTIRLTENDLRKVIKESVNKALFEARKPSDKTVGKHTLKGLRYDKNGNPLYTSDTMSDDEKKNQGWRFSKKHGLYGQLSDPTKLHENKLKLAINEALKRVLKEAGHLYWKDEDGNAYTNSKAKWHGVEGTTFIYHGEWSDPEVWYDGEELNANSLEDYMWEEYKYECEEMGKTPSETEYDNLPTEWFAKKLDDYMSEMFTWQ